MDFWLDKAMKPDGRDIRELGIIVSSVGLEPRGDGQGWETRPMTGKIALR